MYGWRTCGECGAKWAPQSNESANEPDDRCRECYQKNPGWHGYPLGREPQPRAVVLRGEEE